MARTKAFDREEVLQKAIQVFWKKGYNGTSMQDLVDSMGINRGSMYATFGDKHSLYLEALKTYLKHERKGLFGLLNDIPSVLESFDKLLDVIIQSSLEDPEQKGCFMNNSTSELIAVDQEVRVLACDNKEFLVKRFTEMMKNGQEAGEVRTDMKASELASFFYTSMLGLRMDAKGSPDPNSLISSKKIILSALS